ncbi:MAG: cysteine methyltransferase, partial [Candidatus Aminicenantes bacterium]
VSPYLNYLESKFAGNISKSDLNFEKEIYLLSRYFKGEPISFDSLSLDFNMGTPFQRRVWKETRKIPFGQTSSYKELALKINHSGFRSVGQALGRNPFLLVVPCHRVLSSDGSLGGFSAGLPLKKYLLSLEQARQ